MISLVRSTREIPAPILSNGNGDSCCHFHARETGGPLKPSASALVAVRVAPDADAKAVGERMKSGIDPRKWICVEADDLLVAGYGDVVMLIMVSSTGGMTAQSFVDAFQTVVGGTCDFVI